MLPLTRRPRRNRKSVAIRDLIRETHLHPSDLVAPIFVVEGKQEKQPIEGLPDIYRLSLDLLNQKVDDLWKLGVRAIDLFTKIDPSLKSQSGEEAVQRGNLLQRAIDEVKQKKPDMCVMCDIALDPFTQHGHDGILLDGKVINDETVEKLVQMSLLVAEAGVDIVAPSDMMDGRVGAIRKALDSFGFTDVGICAYTAKYASSLYGPFREAVGSGLKNGDKKSYQMDPANVREALLEASLDEEEGADILMVKPALPYLDVLSKLRKKTHLPLAAYHVSGEYAMVKAAAMKGWIDGTAVMMESHLAIKRAGADIIFSYATEELARQLSI
jgi:porphobilinogen synthase